MLVVTVTGNIGRLLHFKIAPDRRTTNPIAAIAAVAIQPIMSYCPAMVKAEISVTNQVTMIVSPMSMMVFLILSPHVSRSFVV